MKRFLAICISLALLLALACPALAFQHAERSAQSLSVDGKTVACDKYNIDGSNYFKLRDLAALLDGTGSRFDVGWDDANKVVSITTNHAYTAPNGHELEIGADLSATAVLSPQTIMIDGEVRTDLTVYNIGGSNFFKLREMGEALGFDVDYIAETNTAVVTSRGAQGADPDETVTHELVQIDGVSAHVLTVNLRNPRVHLSADMVNGTVAARESFADIVAHADGALAVITANFMNGDSEGNYPVGHYMSNGEMKYLSSGFTAVGITADGEVRFGRPSIRVQMRPTGRYYGMYNAIGLNMSTREQEWTLSTLYTPAFGPSFETAVSGNVTAVSGDRVLEHRTVVPGETVAIPADGYVLLLSDAYMQYVPGSFEQPQVGEEMVLEFYLSNPDEEGFTLDGVVQLIAGAPRLVKNGEICTELEAQFSGDRFSDSFASSRTAVGADAEGRLIFVSAASATIPQMRSLMLSLGCVNAVNLDGGASTALYYDGVTYVSPGRMLATTVKIWVD